MESSDELAASLADVEAARLRPYVAGAADPLWIWPVIGLALFVLVASFGVDSPFATLGASVLYCATIGGLIGYAARRRGVQHTMKVSEWPSALRSELARYGVVCAVGVGITVAVCLLVNFVVGGLVAGVLFTSIGVVYSLRWRERVAEMQAALS